VVRGPEKKRDQGGWKSLGAQEACSLSGKAETGRAWRSTSERKKTRPEGDAWVTKVQGVKKNNLSLEKKEKAGRGNERFLEPVVRWGA